MPEPRRIVPDLGVRGRLNETGSAIAKNLIVRRHTNVDTIQPVTANSQQPLGVTMESVADGATGDVQVEGKATVIAGAAVAIGALVTGNASSRAITAASGQFVLGTAETAAAADGDIIEVELASQPTVAP